MEQVLRLNSTDQRITYDVGWKLVSNTTEGPNGTYLLATAEADLFFLFRGTGIRYYGRAGGGGGSLRFRLDSNNTDLSVGGTDSATGPTLLWSVENLKDGDHQLLFLVNSVQEQGSVMVDYFEVVNTAGKGFDMLWAGPNATNVPKEAITVDNTSPNVVLTNPALWSVTDRVQYYKRSAWWTTQAGASLKFTFNGTAIWYYSDLDQPHGFYNVSIDGSEPERLSGRIDGEQVTQQMKWSKTNLSPGTHTFVLTQDDVGGKLTSCDFFRILSADSAPALPSSTPTSTDAIATSDSKKNVVPLAVGLTFGLLTSAIAILGAFYLKRRRRRQSALLDAHAAPLHGSSPTQPTQVGQPSRGLQDIKRLTQPTQTQERLAVPPIIPAARAGSTTSNGGTESELPPSYESHVETPTVATPES